MGDQAPPGFLAGEPFAHNLLPRRHVHQPALGRQLARLRRHVNVNHKLRRRVTPRIKIDLGRVTGKTCKTGGVILPGQWPDEAAEVQVVGQHRRHLRAKRLLARRCRKRRRRNCNALVIGPAADGVYNCLLSHSCAKHYEWHHNPEDLHDRFSSHASTIWVRTYKLLALPVHCRHPAKAEMALPPSRLQWPNSR